MHAATHPLILPAGRGLCDRCERRPAVCDTPGGSVLCWACFENEIEAVAEHDFTSSLGCGSAVALTNAERCRQGPR